MVTGPRLVGWVLVVGLAVACGGGSRSTDGSASATPAGSVDRDTDAPVVRRHWGGPEHPWRVDLEISRRDGESAGACGPVLGRKLRIVNDTPGTKGPIDVTMGPVSPVADPGPADVLVTDVGSPNGSPYQGYVVVRGGSDVTRVELLAGPRPRDIGDDMAPSHGWAVLFWSSDQQQALRVTT
jgi:hypothetical protein